MSGKSGSRKRPRGYKKVNEQEKQKPDYNNYFKIKSILSNKDKMQQNQMRKQPWLTNNSKI